MKTKRTDEDAKIEKREDADADADVKDVNTDQEDIPGTKLGGKVRYLEREFSEEDRRRGYTGPRNALDD